MVEGFSKLTPSAILRSAERRILPERVLGNRFTTATRLEVGFWDMGLRGGRDGAQGDA